MDVQCAAASSDWQMLNSVRAHLESKGKLDLELKNALLHAYAECEPRQAISLWSTLSSQGDELDIKLYLLACANSRDLQLGKKVSPFAYFLQY